MITKDKIFNIANELAHNRTLNECLNPISDFVLIKGFENEDDLYTSEGEYKDEVQNIFNHWFDYYSNIIEKHDKL